MMRCTARRPGISAATEVGMLTHRRPARQMRLLLAVAAVVAASGTEAAADWVRVASSPDVQIFVHAGTLAKDSRGFVSVWTKTVYAVPQTAVGIRYAADMTRFVLDCADARYGVAGGKFLDARGNVLRQFDEPAGELQPIPVATGIDAIAKAVCTVDGETAPGK
ncbi:hypothetical protein LMG28727_06618 [Paraburkholderia kirstenboschensis]|nr:hypothetical protein LMG28727_06618 [Paraburkholderia kirstenboschensis]